eukprot:gb/GFBE01083214.1/.p1 GENE.gb/GFBE01083214.1/~~gb/GFBE01083214.1/.p1  ORF type:complete len:261 (+),score=57.58 gb/GFBE01083214.1/:1-783(+)
MLKMTWINLIVLFLPTFPLLAMSTSTHRLLLTSNGLTTRALKEEFRRMLGDMPEQQTVWYLPTAPLRDGMCSSFVESQVQGLKREFGLGRVEVIDVEHVQGIALEKQVERLGRIGVIWAEMGNTYALRHHLRESGGDKLVRAAMDAGAIYVGSSAGSIVAGRTVQMAFWKDWDDRTAEGTIMVNWQDQDLARGLDLCGGRSFFPHANGPYASSMWQDAQARKHGHTDHEVVKLADGEGFIIDRDKACHVASDDSSWCTVS